LDLQTMLYIEPWTFVATVTLSLTAEYASIIFDR